MFPPPHPPPPSRQVLVGNKSDMDESKRAVAYARGQALADEFRLQFFETSAKTNSNVNDTFLSVARDVIGRLKDAGPGEGGSGSSGPTLRVGGGARKKEGKSSCC